MPRIRSNVCPTCGYKSDAASNIDDESLVPTPGDLSICINCADYLEYDAELKLIRIQESTIESMTDDNLAEMSGNR